MKPPSQQIMCKTLSTSHREAATGAGEEGLTQISSQRRVTCITSTKPVSSMLSWLATRKQNQSAAILTSSLCWFYICVWMFSVQQKRCRAATQLDSDIQRWDDLCQVWDPGRRRHPVGIWMEDNKLPPTSHWSKHSSHSGWIQAGHCLCFPQWRVLV